MHLGPPHRSALRLFLSLAVAAAVIVATPMAWSQDDAPADAMGDAPDSLELTDIADDAVMADPLMLDSIMPNIVVHRSEPRVFLFGTGFAIGTQAFVGLVQLEDPFYASPESMNWTVPAALPPDTYDIRVESPDGQMAEIKGALQIVEDMAGFAPIVVAVEPPEASPGDTITVRGAAFEEGAAVVFDTTIVADVVYINTAAVEIVVPMLPNGTYDVVVINPTGRAGQKDQAFTVVGSVVDALDAPPANPPDDCACQTRGTTRQPWGWTLVAMALLSSLGRSWQRRTRA